MIFVEVLRLLLVLAGAIGGKTIAARVSPGSSAPLIGFVLGAAIAYVLGGIIARLLDKGLLIAVQRLKAMPAGEVFAGSIIGILGLLLGMMVALPVAVVTQSSIAYPLVGALVWVLAAAGVRIGVTKGRQIIDALGLSNLLNPNQAPPSEAILVDTSAMMDRTLPALGRSAVLRSVVVPHFVIDELNTLAQSPDTVKSRRANTGLDTLETLRRVGITVSVMDKEIIEGTGSEDKALILSKRLGLRLATCSGRIVQEAVAEGLAVIDLRNLARSLQADRTPGEHLSIDLVATGQQPRQAIGYLDNGDMVVVNDAAHMVGESQVEVVVSSTRQTSQGQLVFAKLA